MLTEPDHVDKVLTTLAEHGVSALVPHHLPVLWVPLRDGSTLQVGDDEDNHRVSEAGGYCVFRDLESNGVGGPDNDGWIIYGPDVTFDDMIAAVVAEARRVGQKPASATHGSKE